MSVIENPLAYLNETNDIEYDEETPLKSAGEKNRVSAETNILDETPLTTSKDKIKSPRQLNQSDTEQHVEEQKTVEYIPPKAKEQGKLILENDQQNLDDNIKRNNTNTFYKQVASDITHPSEIITVETEVDKPDLGNIPKPEVDFVKLAEKIDSDSEDEDFVPGAVKEDADSGQEEEDGALQRQYSLRDGVKGVAEDTKAVEHDDEDKKKADDLWSAFKADVAIPIKRKARELESTVREKAYDFAGETVTVREDIRNKRKSIASTLGLDRKRRRESAPILPSSRPASTQLVQPDSNCAEAPASSAPGAKRTRPVSKLNSIVNRLTKKPKLNVLTKTELDWKTFKDEKGISDDVKIEAKDEGYLEKQDFLSRTDERQFELEKEIRLQQQRRRQMMNSKQI